MNFSDNEGKQMQAFYTVGHSTRSISELVTLLRAGDVEHVVDVRHMPRSRINPQFNREQLPDSLAPFGISYSHSEALAGLRNRSKTVEDEVNSNWRNRSFHNYADYALSAGFREGLDELVRIGQQKVCAVMCAEAVWWRCHRRIIADHLLHRGFPVYHLMNKDSLQPAKLTDGAQSDKNNNLVYPGQP